MAAALNSRLARFRQELVACLPERWRNRIGSKAAPYILKIGESGSRAVLWRDGRRLHEVELDSLAADTTLAALLNAREYPLVLELPAAWVLRRKMSLPVAARENLKQVIGFEIDRITPFQADQVLFDYRELAERGSESDLLGVEVALVPRKRVQPWLDGLRQAHIQLDRMTGGADGEAFNLLPPELRARPDFGRMALKALPALVLVLLLAAVLLLPLWQAQKVVAGLQREEQGLRHQAGQVLKLRERLQQQLAELEKIRDHWQSVPPPLEVLQVLTRLLPDDTYLQQLDIKGKRLVVRGLSGQASSLIGLLERFPAFDEPHFLSPVTQQRGKELFQLEAQIRTPFPRDTLNEKPAPAGKTNGAGSDG